MRPQLTDKLLALKSRLDGVLAGLADERAARVAKKGLRVESLEDRCVPSWGATPPATIAVPTSATAVALNSSGDATGNATISANENDFYRFTAATAGSYVLEATTPSSSLDTVIALYNASGSRVAFNDDVASGNTDSRTTATLTAGQVYYLGVTNYTGTAGGAYTWKVDGPSASPPVTPPPPPAGDDGYEDNDTRATARSLGTLTANTTLNNLVSRDADFFSFTTSAAGTSSNSVSIAFTHAQGDLDMRLYNSAGTVVGSSGGSGNSETVSLSGLAAGTYTVEVFGYNGAINPGYSLTVAPPSGTTPPPTVDAWTVMVYITASNLQQFAAQDVNEMEKAVASLPANVNVVVYWDQSSTLTKYATGNGSQAAWGTAGRAQLVGDTNMNSVATTFQILGEQNTGNPATLTSFLQWGAATAPAEKYSLLLWNHGSGLDGSNYDDSDGVAMDYLTMPETVSAIGAAGNPRIDVLGYDACLMGMAEIGYALRNSGTVFAGAEELTAGTGHDYATLFNVLRTNPQNVTAEQLGAAYVTSFSNQYVGTGVLEDTYSATRTSQYGNFAAAVKTFVDSTAGASGTVLTALRNARNSAVKYDTADFKDLKSFLTLVNNNTSIPATIRTAASGALTAITNLVVSKTADQRNSGGVAVYLPSSSVNGSYGSDYAAWNTATGWGAFANWLATGTRSLPGSGGGRSGPAQRAEVGGGERVSAPFAEVTAPAGRVALRDVPSADKPRMLLGELRAFSAITAGVPATPALPDDYLGSDGTAGLMILEPGIHGVEA